ncbi:MAG: hypothetical protein IKJ52_04575, partial [Muribaculaceae bacterium]|nr:hypothetical protein [Muribaculaceae bacterium]
DLNTSNGALTHRYYVRDYLGSTRAVIDESGNVLQSTAYYPSGVPLTPNSLTPQTIKLHTGKDFFDLQGAGWYDNQARYCDCLIPTFKSIDPLAEKYPWLSPYNHCANNPLRYTDPSGKIIEADPQSQLNIKFTLTPDEAKYVAFLENGVIDTELLNKCNSTSINMTALKTLANSTKNNYVFNVTNSGHDGRSFYESDNTGFYRGLTEMPNATCNPSPDKNVYILVGSCLGQAQQVKTTAHEAYGHGYMYELTNDTNASCHTYNNALVYNGSDYEIIFTPSNKPLENLINQVVNQATFNYETYYK